MPGRQYPRDYRDGEGLGAILVVLGVVLAFGALLLLSGVR